MYCVIRGIVLIAVTFTVVAGCGGGYTSRRSPDSASQGFVPQVLRYRVAEVYDQNNPGLEWQLDPPLSPVHDAVQVLFWASSGHFKICKSGEGRHIRADRPFMTPRPLQDTIFQLSVDHIEGDTIITLSFVVEGTTKPAASLRMPGIHELFGPSDQYLISIEETQ